MKTAQPTPLLKHLKCLYARRYTCLYIKRVGTLMFTKCLLNSLQKMEFLTEGSKILNRFVWIFLIEFCKELKSIYQSEIIHDAYLSKIISETKGQLILKCLFGVFKIFQKTNGNKSIWGIIAVKSYFSIRFLEELRVPKSPFEIN